MSAAAAAGAAEAGASAGEAALAAAAPAPARPSSMWRTPRAYSSRRSTAGMVSLTSSRASKSRSQAWKSGNASASTRRTPVTSSNTASQ
uniref:Gst41 n=1 Tax=Arundo donax TaxID=35708 RepID=A0A0A9EX27_ARUDO